VRSSGRRGASPCSVRGEVVGCRGGTRRHAVVGPVPVPVHAADEQAGLEPAGYAQARHETADPALDPAALSIAGGMGQDTVTNQAVVAFNDALNPTAPGRLVLADLDSGQVSQFPQLSTFFAAGVAVDSTTHQALVPFLDGSAIYDLTTGAGKTLSLGGGTYWHPAVDRGRGLFLMQETAPPDFFGSAPNNNAASAVVVIDEQGNLVRRIEAFNFFNTFLLNAGAYVQVSPTTGTAYTLGPGGAQLYPFDYIANR
jgi:hypothetical protein